MDVIYDYDRIVNRMGDYGRISIALSDDEVAHWKRMGHWKHIQSELQSLPNILHACVDHTNQLGTHYNIYYFFFTPSKDESRDIDKYHARVFAFLTSIYYHNKQIRLMDINVEDACDQLVVSNSGPRSRVAHGTINTACKLF